MCCAKCGAQMPEDSEFCPACGAPTTDEAVILPGKRGVSLSLKAKAAVIASAIIVGALLIIWAAMGIRLKRNITKEWKNTDGTILMILDVENNTMEYRIETSYSWLNSTLFDAKWHYIAGNRILVRVGDTRKLVTVKFNDDKTMMILSPALTSSDSSENWFYID